MGAPPLPEKRKYSVQSGMKVFFPQVRVMKEHVNGTIPVKPDIDKY